MNGRFLSAAAAVALVAAACGALPIKSTTQEDRVATSRRVAEREKGSVVSEAELDQMDLDSTYVCETESVVGSHLKRYQCRTLRRVQRERDMARAYLEGTMTPLPPAMPPQQPDEAVAAGGAGGDQAGTSTTIENLLRGSKTRQISRGDGGTPAPGAPASLDPRYPPL